MLKTDKANQTALTARFELLARKGDTAGMEEAARLLQERAPDSEVGFIQEARLRLAEKNYDAAISLYEKVLETQPGNAISTNNLAALLADHRTDEASLARAAKLSADLEKTKQPAFLDTAAWVYYRNGNYDKASEILKGVVEKAPKVPVFQYHLGMVYYKQGNKDAARKYLSQATDGDFEYQGIEEARATLKSL